MPQPRKEPAEVAEARARLKNPTGDKNAQLKDIRQMHEYAYERINEIVDAAEHEDRSFTASENRELDHLQAEQKKWLAEEERLLRKLGVGPDNPGAASRGTGRRYFDAENRREIRAFGPGESMFTGSADDPTFGELVAGAVRSAIGARMSEQERRALEAATGSKGGYTVSEEMSSRTIDLLRAASRVVQAGADSIPVNAESMLIAKVTADGEPAWGQENSAVPETDPEFAAVKLLPRRISRLTKLPVELAMDAANLPMLVERMIVDSLASEIDRAFMFGSGLAGGAKPEPLGIVNTMGVNAVAHDGPLTNYAPFLEALQAVEEDNADVTNAAAIMAPRTWYTLQGLTATDNQPLVAPQAVQDLRMLRTTKVPTDEGSGDNESRVVLGDYGDFLIGWRQQIVVEVLSELFRQNLQIGILAWARVDAVVTRPGSFAVISGVQPTP